MRLFTTIAFLALTLACQAQFRFSLSTDFDVQRNFSPKQQYWAIGQTIRGEWHAKPRTGFYGWLCYYNWGRFSNELEAVARDPGTSPAVIPYRNRGRMRFTQLSIGLKHYIKGHFEAEEGWNLYGLAGLGALMGAVDNSAGIALPDTMQYRVPVLDGKHRFNRLTLDLGVGFETPVGGDLFLYTEARTLIPLTYFPSPIMANTYYTPLTGVLAVGVRMLF